MARRAEASFGDPPVNHPVLTHLIRGGFLRSPDAHFAERYIDGRLLTFVSEAGLIHPKVTAATLSALTEVDPQVIRGISERIVPFLSFVQHQFRRVHEEVLERVNPDADPETVQDSCRKVREGILRLKNELDNTRPESRRERMWSWLVTTGMKALKE